MSEKIAIIRLKGDHDLRFDVKDTLEMLNLYKKHSCVIVPKKDSYLGMIKKIKDTITYGIINEETEKKLIEKRGEKDKEGKLKKEFHLHPPRGGFERKGTKKPFNLGGALGNRKEKINDLIIKML